MATMRLCSRFFFSFSLSLLMMFISRAIAQPSLAYLCSNNKGNYTANSTYKTNLHHLLSSLPTDNHVDYGFYNISYGENVDRVNAIGLCRGDVELDACRSCLNDSIAALPRLCPNQKEAVGWYDSCMLRYSNQSLFGVLENDPALVYLNTRDATDPHQFNQVVQSLLGNLTDEAASGDSRLKFAAGDATIRASKKIYALVQCTPDLTERQCIDCLDDALGVVEKCCAGKEGIRVLKSSCNVRYEMYSFFNSTEISSASPPSPPPPFQPIPSPSPSPNRTTNIEGNQPNTSQTVTVIVLPLLVVIIFAVLIVSIFIFLRARKPRVNGVETVDETADLETLAFDISTIRTATDNFSDAKNIGQGGFGVVYKGRLINGLDIAVKRLSQNSMQGDDEFKNEVLLVAKLQHRNLVRLLGFCLNENERLLVYELVQNSSLDKFLFDPLKRVDLTWEKRYKIIGGIARGLIYLHEDSQIRIIHRDLKAANILLDAEMNPKISDFGMAKLFEQDQTRGETSRIVGTYGYMAPEYLMQGNFSIKSDVFSFGVLVLEIVSGQKNNYFYHEENRDDLTSYAWRNWREGTPLNVVDPILRGGSSSEMKRCIHIGLLCVQENLVDRPTMDTVLLMLNSYSVTLPILSPPAFVVNNNTQSDMSSQWRSSSHVTEIESDRSGTNLVQVSVNEASITEPYPR